MNEFVLRNIAVWLFTFIGSPTLAEVATITLHLQTNEEKIFKFANDGSIHPLSSGMKLISCNIGFQSVGTYKFASLACFSTTDKKNLGMFSIKAVCDKLSEPEYLYFSGGKITHKSSDENINFKIQCTDN